MRHSSSVLSKRPISAKIIKIVGFGISPVRFSANRVGSLLPVAVLDNVADPYVTLIPDVREGDTLVLTFNLSDCSVQFKVKFQRDLQQGFIYDFPMSFTSLAAKATTEAWKADGIDEGIIWNPSGRSVELVIDGHHVGNYLLCEQIKIGSKRLNINGGNDKLHAGPVWDFDRGTFQNPTEAQKMGSGRVKSYNAFLSSSSKVSKSGGYKENQQPCLWYPLLMNDPEFVTMVKSRWSSLYPRLRAVTDEIVRLGAENALSWEYDSTMWPGTATALNAGAESGFAVSETTF